MTLPMIILSLGCIIFGVWHTLPLESFIKPALTESLHEALQEVHFAFGLGELFWVTIIVLAIAVINHVIGVKFTGKGVGASEHIHHAPVLSTIYDLAERRVFDPYDQGRVVFRYGVQGLYLIDRGVDWIYQKLVPVTANWIAETRRVHNGLYANYLAWALGGLVLVGLYLMG